jgi:hypothetical protein
LTERIKLDMATMEHTLIKLQLDLLIAITQHLEIQCMAPSSPAKYTNKLN